MVNILASILPFDRWLSHCVNLFFDLDDLSRFYLGQSAGISLTGTQFSLALHPAISHLSVAKSMIFPS